MIFTAQHKSKAHLDALAPCLHSLHQGLDGKLDGVLAGSLGVVLFKELACLRSSNNERSRPG